MRRFIFLARLFSLTILISLIFLISAQAYWIWTPETKKFVNPKYAAKDSPQEQFEWAMSFYNAKDFQRAAAEFDKVTKHYEYSEYASKAQYYMGLSYENMGKYYTAFQNYQKAVDNFPHIENMDEILAREFNIAKIYATKDNPKVMGADIMTSLDRAIEIYKKVVENAPYGRLAEEAQFEMGLALKRAERYDEAIEAFQKILDDYPASKFVDKAQYELADTAYRSSLSPAYDAGPTDKAIRAFEELSEGVRGASSAVQVGETVQRLKDKAAEKSILIARFYESRKRYESAIIYYQDSLDRFPDSSFAAEARNKIEQMKGRIGGPDKAGAKIEETEKPRKEGWNLFGFGKKTDPKVKGQSEEIQAPKKAWSPLKFDRKAVFKPVKEKKPWSPFDFGKKKKESAPVITKSDDSAAAVESPEREILTTEVQLGQ